MASYVIRHLSGELIGRAKATASKAGVSLDAVLIRFLESYAEHGTAFPAQSAGGLARAANQTPEERIDSARNAVNARWEKHRSQRDPPTEGA